MIDDFRLKIEGMLSIRIKKTERSDTTNRHSSFVNHQFGSGFAGLGLSQKFIVKPVIILGILALPFNLIFYFAEYK